MDVLLMALPLLHAGLTAVQEELQRLQVNPAALPRLHHAQQQPTAQLLALQQLLWDCQLQVLLLSTDFAAAQQVLDSSLAAVDAYPAQLGAFLPQGHLQAGLYALALEEYGAAHAHFAAAGQAGEEALFRPACQALGALALLGQTGPAGGEWGLCAHRDVFGDSQALVCCDMGAGRGKGQHPTVLRVC
jgi:hypothetical protein